MCCTASSSSSIIGGACLRRFSSSAGPLCRKACAVAITVFVTLRCRSRIFLFKPLQTAFDDRSAGLVYLKVDPAFDALRGDSRFAGRLHRIRS